MRNRNGNREISNVNIKLSLTLRKQTVGYLFVLLCWTEEAVETIRWVSVLKVTEYYVRFRIIL
jgi:hypothetical protein